MGINPLKWKFRTFIYVILALFVIYMLLIYKKNHTVVFEFEVKNVKPEVIWEFVADFSNMLKLNPTIEEFNIINESGNFDHWKYSVEYKEHLSHLPSIKNTGLGHFSILQEENVYLIRSNHITCFFSSFDCVNSISEFKFISSGKDTKCIEKIDYECPIVFSKFCHNEVMIQRNHIMNNLQKHYSMLNIHISKDD